MTATGRRSRTAAADELCRTAWETTFAEIDGAGPGREVVGLALVAVGGYGRRELAPHSDLDLVLVHDDADASVPVRPVAERLWYPMWDAGVALDHSVRALSEVTDAARADPRVALGLLDSRHVAGDPALTLRLRAELLAHWRRDARRQLPALRTLVRERGSRQGELAHASVPDLKASVGGLRDATVLQGLVATWLVDVPHADLERSRLQLLDVRDALHEVNGRATDRIAPELWQDLAERLGLPDAAAAQRQVRGAARRITHLTRLTWHRVDALLARPAAVRRRAPELERVAPGVAVSAGEVVLDRGTRPAADPLLLLRAAAEAAERGLALAPATAARLSRDGVPVPEPWGPQARNLLVRLLAAGPGLLPVWETLDETGALQLLLPEWERVRLLPHASVVHRFTVDRHLVETCIEAARLIRRVTRVDVLMVAALLHDIGKGQRVDHSVAGEPLAAQVAARLGFDERERLLVRSLVRHHLLLAEVATSRDLADPATTAYVAERVPDTETLELLAALTEADARATSPQAWTAWRAGLVADLVSRTRTALAGSDGGVPVPPSFDRVPVSAAVREDPLGVDVHVRAAEAVLAGHAADGTADGATVTVVSGDRIGLMADVAGTLAMARTSVRSARAWTQDDVAVSRWEVDDAHLDQTVLRQRLEAVVERRVDPRSRLRPPREERPEPVVQLRHDVSEEATVLEVRVDDRPGVLFLVCDALAALEVSVRSAHVTTLGPQAVDVLYVQEPGAGRLSDERAAAAVHAVRRALQLAARLDV